MGDYLIIYEAPNGKRLFGGIHLSKEVAIQAARVIRTQYKPFRPLYMIHVKNRKSALGYGHPGQTERYLRSQQKENT